MSTRKRKKVKSTGSTVVVVTAEIADIGGEKVVIFDPRSPDPRRRDDEVAPGETFVVRSGDTLRWKLRDAKGKDLAELGDFQPRVRFEQFPNAGMKRPLLDKLLEKDPNSHTFRAKEGHIVSRNAANGGYQYSLELFNPRTGETIKLACRWRGAGGLVSALPMAGGDKDGRP